MYKFKLKFTVFIRKPMKTIVLFIAKSHYKLIVFNNFRPLNQLLVYQNFNKHFSTSKQIFYSSMSMIEINHFYLKKLNIA